MVDAMQFMVIYKFCFYVYALYNNNTKLDQQTGRKKITAIRTKLVYFKLYLLKVIPDSIILPFRIQKC